MSFLQDLYVITFSQNFVKHKVSLNLLENTKLGSVTERQRR